MKKLSVYIVFLGIVLPSFSQSFQSEIDKDEVMIGEPFEYRLTIKSESQLGEIKYEPHTKKMLGKRSGGASETQGNDYFFELSVPFSDTVYQEDGNYIWEGIYKLIAWDSAYVILPPEFITIHGREKNFPPQLIRINSPTTDASQPLYDIHEIFTETKPKNRILHFLKRYGWLGIPLLLLLIYFYRKRKKKEGEEEVIELTLKEKILQRINQLEAEKGYEQNLKEYYVDLSVILRDFLGAHFQERMMDKTTKEIDVILNQRAVSEPLRITIRQLLMQSDMVKFAKSRPETAAVKMVTQRARKVVIVISKEENDE